MCPSSLFFCFVVLSSSSFSCFFFNDTATTEIYTLSLHDALPIFGRLAWTAPAVVHARRSILLPLRIAAGVDNRSEEHTSELQSLTNLVCRLLLEKKKKKQHDNVTLNNERIVIIQNHNTQV